VKKDPTNEGARKLAQGGPLAIRLPEKPAREDAGTEESRGRGFLSMLYSAAAIVFVVCLVKLYIEQYIEIDRLMKRSVVAQQEMETAKSRYEEVAEEVEYLETLEGVERLARDKLRYIRPDEVILVPLRPEAMDQGARPAAYPPG
jgi:cell division protein FtsB